jgi:Phytanoyl-CoA dioxygenase (PhyH)
MITEIDIESYKRDGFFIAKQILPFDEIDVVQKDFFDILNEQIKFICGDEYKENAITSVHELMILLFNKDKARYLSCLKVAARLYSLQRLMMNPDIVSYIKALGVELPIMQARPVFHVMSHELKFLDGYFGFDVHQDWPALQSSLDMITAWIPLVNVDKELFPLEVIPGSHLLGLCSGHITKHIVEINANKYNESDFVPIEVAKGDVIFMSGFSLHRSGKNGRHNAVRLASSCRYENAKEKYFVEHGFPFCQHTIVNRDLIIDNFPNNEQVRDVYNK